MTAAVAISAGAVPTVPTVPAGPAAPANAAAAAPPAAPPTWRPLVGLAGIFLAAMVAGLNNRVGSLALADVRGALGFGLDDASWIVSVYAAGELIAMPLAAWFAVTLSVRRFHLLMLASSTALAALLPLVHELPLLLVLRGLQGVVGGAQIPVLMMAALRFLPPPIRLYGLSLYAMTATFAPNLGLWLAGQWADHLMDWRWVYWQTIPLAPVAAAPVFWGIPQDPVKLDRFRGANWTGMACGVVALGLLAVAMDQGVRLDWLNSPFIGFALLGGLGLLAVYPVSEWCHPAPFIRPQMLFGQRNLGLGFIVFFGLLISLVSGSLPIAHLAQVQDYRAQQSAPVGLIVGLPQLVLGPLVALLLYRKWADARIVFCIGLGAIALSCLFGSRLNDRDFKVAVASAAAEVLSAQATIASARANLVRQQSAINQARTSVTSDDASLKLAALNQTRYRNLAADGAGSEQASQQAEAQLTIQQASRDRSASGLVSTQQQVDVLKADLLKAQAALAQAQAAQATEQLKLSYTRITAPIGGTVGQKSVRVGAFVAAGKALLAIVPLEAIYVQANFRETQLATVRPGQAVKLKFDALPGVMLTGQVESLGPATGATYAAVAPTNATGNFTKIVQRLPVRIRIDRDQADAKRLRVGMSVQPEIGSTTAAELQAGQAGALIGADQLRRSPRRGRPCFPRRLDEPKTPSVRRRTDSRRRVADSRNRWHCRQTDLFLRKGVMYKFSLLLHYRKDIPVDQLRSDWADRHGLIALALPGLRRYVQNHWAAAPPPYERAYDGSADLWFDDEAACTCALSGPVGKELSKDELRLFDHGMKPAYVGAAIEERVLRWEAGPGGRKQ